MSDHISKFRLGGPDGPEYTVTLKDDLLPQQASPALYHVVCNDREGQIVVQRTNAITTRNATVNGIQNDLDRAAFVMFDKVKATSDLRRDGVPTEFTLYHVPARGAAMDVTLTAAELAGQTTPDARQLSKVLADPSRPDHPVVWSVHSRGALVFDMAARNCAREGVKLPHDSVAVYNGAVNEHVMNRDLGKAGIGKLGRGYFNNPGDPVPQLVGDNTINPIRRATALYNTYEVVTSDQSLHTWHVPLTEKDYASVPPAQWEEPGVDRRPPLTAAHSAETSRGGGKSAAVRLQERLPRAELDQATRSLVSEAIAGREAYAIGTPAERTALLRSCRSKFRGDLPGPDLTGVPLRTAALGFIEGTVASDQLLSLARKHSNAMQRESRVDPSRLIPDLGLGR